MKKLIFQDLTPLFLIVIVSLAGCAGYAPGQQSYWDAQVREMCLKDGGVTLYERIRISKTDIDRRILPMTSDGRLSVAIKELAHPDAPVYGVERITTLHQEGNLRVSRRELQVIRRIDQVIVAKQVSYGRFGGDLPTGLVHDSSYGCPDRELRAARLAELFIVDGVVK
ncbi:MAG: hypothetical protein Q8K18_19690 [Burkholderiales bacterium]|nr:hypothetical protein [Burkholderiales bacterium]